MIKAIILKVSEKVKPSLPKNLLNGGKVTTWLQQKKKMELSRSQMKLWTAKSLETESRILSNFLTFSEREIIKKKKVQKQEMYQGDEKQNATDSKL